MNSKSLSDYYYNHSFMDGLRKKLPKLLPNTYCIAAIDIEHFRLFNKLYGRSSGDEVIRYICACLKQSTMENDGIDAYLGGDNFVALLPDSDELLCSIREKIVGGRISERYKITSCTRNILEITYQGGNRK